MTKTIIFILLLVSFAPILGRHAPFRNYDGNWLALIEDPKHLDDARIMYQFLREVKNKETGQKLRGIGYNSEESNDFVGFHHPFFYKKMEPKLEELLKKTKLILESKME